MKTRWMLPVLLLASSTGLAAQEKKVVVEDVIARVNNEIITLSDLQRARGSVRREVEDECQGCPKAKLEAMVREREANLLRDLIDQSLLVQRGKDIGISVEAEVIKRLDEIRQRNNIPDMEALEKAISAAGIPFEDYKANIRNGLLSQEVIRREVGGNLKFPREELQKYYEEHKEEFVRPEKVYLSEIFVTTEGKTESEIALQEQRAKVVLERLKKGEEFSELARRHSDGSTAQQGGELGGFERGQLAPELEGIVFKKNRGDITDVVRTKTGFLILRVDQRFEAGLQPLEKVENEIMNRLYFEKMQPGLRAYLTKLREESYVLVKPGYTDTSAIASNPIEEVAADPEEGKGKKSKKGKKKKAAE